MQTINKSLAPAITEQSQAPGLRIEHNFKFQKSTIHVELIDGKPHFIAKDICDALGLGNPTESLRNLDDDEKLTSVVVRSGQRRKVNYVTESGLYGLIFQSRKPEAKRFRKWVTSEVLPAIRNNGFYMLGKQDTEGITAGLFSIVYGGNQYFAYTEALRHLGLSTRSGSVYSRRKKHPVSFLKIWGRNFVTRKMLLAVYEQRQARELALNQLTLNL